MNIEVQSNPISVHLSTRVTFFILADSPYIHLHFALLLNAIFCFYCTANTQGTRVLLGEILM